MAELKLISAESVTEGHPDKVCDQISDAILDDMLAQDPQSHVAVETCATVGQFFVFGEVTSDGYSDIQNIVRSVVRNIGYTSSRVGLDADSAIWLLLSRIRHLASSATKHKVPAIRV